MTPSLAAAGQPWLGGTPPPPARCIAARAARAALRACLHPPASSPRLSSECAAPSPPPAARDVRSKLHARSALQAGRSTSSNGFPLPRPAWPCASGASTGACSRSGLRRSGARYSGLASAVRAVSAPPSRSRTSAHALEWGCLSSPAPALHSATTHASVCSSHAAASTSFCLGPPLSEWRSMRKARSCPPICRTSPI
eukprot:scaffold32331_cov64-Phaeocystis_antarctica.AAC.3